MRKAVVSASLIAAGLLAFGAAQAQQALVTPAYTYTTVTTSPVFVTNGPDIPAGPDYPYEYPGRSKVVTPAPALIRFVTTSS